MNLLKCLIAFCNKPAILMVCLLSLQTALAQETSAPDESLKDFDYYMGIWLLPSDHPAVSRNPKFKDLRVIDFTWGDNKKLIHSSTGIISETDSIPFSEGIITVNPTTEKITWLEYQYEGDLLFEGEYIPMDDGMLQRLYTVRYAKGYKNIPNPQEPGWSRLYRETFVPLSTDTIDWITETYIGGNWIEAGTPGGSKAVRMK